MITTYVFFDFNTKEEWFEFHKNFTKHKEFIKYSPVCKGINEHNANFEDAVIYYFDDLKAPWLFVNLFISTKSAKLLKSLNEFIKEHHYENNYELRCKYGKLRMDIDELIEKYKK